MHNTLASFPSPPSGNYQNLLKLAALFEEDFSIDWLVELSNTKASQVLFALEEGARHGWLIRKKAAGTFCFANLLERRKWQGRLAPEAQEALHTRIAEFIMKEFPENDKKALILGYHLQHITNNIERCRWLMKAGDVYRRIYQVEESLTCYQKALADLSGIEGEEADELFIRTAINYSKVSTVRHHCSETLSILEDARVRAKKWNKQGHQALLDMHLAKNEWYCSKYTEAQKHFEQGLSRAISIGQPKLLYSANTFATFFLWWQGRFQEAIAHYEKHISEVQSYPQEGFPIVAAITVGYCYAQIGQITQGLGMLDAIRTECKARGDLYMSAQAGIGIGAILLDIRRVDDALQYLERSIEEGRQVQNKWVGIWGNLMLALVYHLKKEKKRTIECLQKFLESSTQVQMTARLFPYLLELCWFIEEGELPAFPGLSLKNEIRQAIEGKNVLLKGIAYRYQALLQKKMGLPPKKIIQSLNLSQIFLEECGGQIELAKSQLELARQYLLIRDDQKAREMTCMASKIMKMFNESLLPDDLRFLIREISPDENLLKEIMTVGKEIVTIRDNRELAHHIISTVNRITGAERGAIFLLDENPAPRKIQLRASKNLTSEQVAHPGFASSMRMIEEVSRTGKGRILGASVPDEADSPSKEVIRSCICVPLVLRDKVVGVLYHDNRLLSSAFKESDLDLLSYFAAQAAIAMDNARAYEEIQRLNRKLSEEKSYYEEQHLQSFHFEDIVGESPALKKVLDKINQVSKTDTTILIFGETGVGKELVARAIHRHSLRNAKPFIRVFCNALPESLIPSELFGHEKGAFTGAINRRLGRFELADGGTLFLDEIGDLPPDIQVRLLRVLQTKEFERVGGNETIRSDFRLIAATNRDLEQEVETGRFRSDLYYRLNVFPIPVPPLRERKEDIPLLTHYFFKIYATKMGKSFDGIPKSEMDRLTRYHWPGNVRELENVIERGTILSQGPYFRVPELGAGHPEPLRPDQDPTLSGNERRHILWALQKTAWRVRGPGGAAELLKINPSTLNFRMKKLGIPRPPEFSKKKRKLEREFLLR